MNQKDLEYFRTLILQKREEALQNVELMESNSSGTNKADAREDSRYTSHLAEQGSVTMEKELNSYFGTRTRKYIAQLDAALHRIEDGSYGTCIDCGKPISRERLEEVPHTRHCVPCKTKKSG